MGCLRGDARAEIGSCQVCAIGATRTFGGDEDCSTDSRAILAW